MIARPIDATRAARRGKGMLESGFMIADLSDMHTATRRQRLQRLQNTDLKILANGQSTRRPAAKPRDSTWTQNEGRARARQSNRPVQPILSGLEHVLAAVDRDVGPGEERRLLARN